MFFPKDTPEIAAEKFAQRHSPGRIGSAEELGELIQFLMSDVAGSITGTSITIDGGQSSRLAMIEIKGKEMEP